MSRRVDIELDCEVSKDVVVYTLLLSYVVFPNCKRCSCKYAVLEVADPHFFFRIRTTYCEL